MFKLFLIFFISSCAFLVEKLDKQIIEKKDYFNLLENEQNFCPIDRKFEIQLTGSSQITLEEYLDLAQKSPYSLDFIDHLVLYTLLQFTVRPDLTSATSRFQIMLHHLGNTYYFDFLSEESENQFPMIFGLDWILKKFGKKRKIEDYVTLLKPDILKKIKISKEFELFLVRNKEKIKKDQSLVAHYFRGADVLKESETSPLLDYRKLLSIYRSFKKDQKIVINTSLIDFVTERGDKGSCNYDFNLYQNSIFLIDKEIPVANLFGVHYKGSAFFASTSQKIDNFTSLSGLPLFKGISKVRSSAFCKIEKDGKKIWTLSNQSRDPGQHLFHLMRYGLLTAQSVLDVNKLMGHSRHLFLSDPIRLIIESQRSSKEQVDNLLKLNLPIYHAEKLGNIWAYTLFEEGARFIIDDRNVGAYLCQ